MKHAKEIEKIVKGFSNNWRIRILELLEIKSGLTLIEICDELKINVKTGSEHTLKLKTSGLISKKYDGGTVTHMLTDRGKLALKFCKSIE